MSFGVHPMLGRRATLAAAAGALLAGRARAADRVLRIGYQKYGTLPLLRARHTLEDAAGKLGWTVSWSLFPGGPALLEALAAGAIDFGQTGEAPPILSQAAGTELVYVGCNPPAPTGEAIVVPAASTLRDLAGLKGRTIAFNKGSNVQYLVVKALRSAGLAFRDIQPAFLAPADARAAFERGSVDAWAIWDPFLASVQAETGARTLADATGLAPNRQFFLATRAFAAANASILDALFTTLDASDAVARNDLPAASRLLAEAVGLPGPVSERCMSRLGLGLQPMTPDVVADQQAIADAFLDAHLIPAPIRVAAAVWSRPA